MKILCVRVWVMKNNFIKTKIMFLCLFNIYKLMYFLFKNVNFLQLYFDKYYFSSTIVTIQLEFVIYFFSHSLIYVNQFFEFCTQLTLILFFA